MQFKVPQFLEIEDKIFGPFTFREFAYLAGGAGICFIIYRLLGLILGVIPILFIIGLSLLLTFYRPNDKPFINMVESFLKYILQDKLYIWKRRKNKTPKRNADGVNIETQLPIPSAPKLNSSKLRDLAWSLDVLDTKKQLGGVRSINTEIYKTENENTI